MHQHNRKIAVIGLGYVGLPLVVHFGQSKRVVGFDINEQRVRELSNGYDRTCEVESNLLSKADVLYTAKIDDLKQADFYIVAVPTPVDEAKQPDLTPVISASGTVGKCLKKGDIVVFESTVYPGVTEEVCVPALERVSGLKAGVDFKVGYAPERMNPGDKQYTLPKITRVVSAQDNDALEVVASVYGSIIEAGVYRAPSIKVAEASKIVENIQRDVNIALMNELAKIFHEIGVDTHDVLAAARSKWNFLNFAPGLVGGHCIGVDPYYMTYRAAKTPHQAEFIALGRRINDGMSQFVAQSLVKSMVQNRINVADSRVTVLGFAFKENVPDVRNTRVAEIARELSTYGIEVQLHDPLVDPGEVLEEYRMELIPREKLRPSDAVVLAVPHRSFLEEGWDLVSSLLKDRKGPVIDIRASLRRGDKPAGVELWRL